MAGSLMTDPGVQILIAVVTSLLASFIYDRLNKVGRGEYSKRLAAADKNLIKWLNLHLGKKKLPPAAVLVQFVASLARRYRVELSDLRSLEEIEDELIWEVMEEKGVKIPSEDKYATCEYIAKWKSDIILDKKSYNSWKARQISAGGALPVLGFAVICFQSTFVLGLLWRSGQFVENYSLVGLSVVAAPVVIWLLGLMLSHFWRVLSPFKNEESVDFESRLPE